MNKLEITNLVLAATQTVLAAVTFSLLINHYPVETTPDSPLGDCRVEEPFEYVDIHISRER